MDTALDTAGTVLGLGIALGSVDIVVRFAVGTALQIAVDTLADTSRTAVDPVLGTLGDIVLDTVPGTVPHIFGVYRSETA